MTIICEVCKRSGTLHGPIQRVHFTLSNLTLCPCGGLHETLPSALSTTSIMEERK